MNGWPDFSSTRSTRGGATGSICFSRMACPSDISTSSPGHVLLDVAPVQLLEHRAGGLARAEALEAYVPAKLVVGLVQPGGDVRPRELEIHPLFHGGDVLNRQLHGGGRIRREAAGRQMVQGRFLQVAEGRRELRRPLSAASGALPPETVFSRQWPPCRLPRGCLSYTILGSSCRLVVSRWRIAWGREACPAGCRDVRGPGFSSAASRSRWAKARRTSPDDPAAGMCEPCKKKFVSLHDKQRRCDVPGCQNTWTWPAAAQLEAFAAHKPPPKQLCASCEGKLAALEDKQIACSVPGCTRTGTLSRAAAAAGRDRGRAGRRGARPWRGAGRDPR